MRTPDEDYHGKIAEALWYSLNEGDAVSKLENLAVEYANGRSTLTSQWQLCLKTLLDPKDQKDDTTMRIKEMG